MPQGVISLTGINSGFYTPPLSVCSGLAFEEYIFRQMSIGKGSSGDNLTFQRSPRTGDDGKDIIINGQLVSLFGQKIGSQGKIICEVKFSSGGILSLSRFGDTLLRAGEEIDTIIIISNNAPSPRTIFHSSRQASLINKKLCFISGWELNEYFAHTKTQNDIVFNIQMLTTQYPHRFNYYVKNISRDDTRYVSLSSQNDEISKFNDQLEFFLGPGEYQTGEILLQDVGDQLSDKTLNLYLTVDEKIQRTKISRRIDASRIELPFWGQANLSELSDFEERLKSKSNSILLVEGAAGIGKSRFIHELGRRVRSSGRPYLVIDCESIDNIDHINKKIKEESEYLTNDFSRLHKGSTIEKLIMLLRSDQLSHLVLVLDDAHKLSKVNIQLLKDELSTSKSVNRLILTSRNDDSFFNPEYLKFIDWLRSSVQASKAISLKPLNPEEENSLLKYTVEKIPSSLIDRIRYLSNGIPYYILISLEWLVENDLFQIVNNQRVALVNNIRFGDKDMLPKKIEDILKYSLQRILEMFPKDFIISSFINAVDPYKENLISKLPKLHLSNNTFFDLDENTNAVYWRHDLAKAAFIKFITEDIDFRDQLELIYASDKSKQLDDSVLGQLAYNLLEYDVAWAKWEELRKKLLRLKNFTSLDIEGVRYEYLPMIAELAFIKKDEVLAIQSLMAWCYMGCHHANIAMGSQACEKSLQLLKKFNIAHVSNLIRIDLLRLRTLIDAGLLDSSLKLSIEIGINYQSYLNYCLQDEQFDYYLNMSDIYRLFNYREAAVFYLNQISPSKLKELPDLEYVLETHKIALHIDQNERIAALNRLMNSDKKGTDRHEAISKIRLTRLEILMGNKAGDEKTIDYLNKLIQHMLKMQYTSAIPVAYRVLSLCAYSASLSGLFTRDYAKSLYQNAENSCIFKGESASLPLIYNDLGILEFQLTNRIQDSMVYLSTAIDTLSKQGRLNIGQGDLTSSSQVVISNYLKMLCHVKYSYAINFIIDRVTWFEKSKVISRLWANNELERIIETQGIFLAKDNYIYQLRCPISDLHLVG